VEIYRGQRGTKEEVSRIFYAREMEAFCFSTFHLFIYLSIYYLFILRLKELCYDGGSC